jgi:formylmethanofuran dehydrogenase subunit B
MVEARVLGHVVSRAAAVAEASKCLSSARCPVIAGMDSDVAGLRSAIAIATRLRCPYDHAGSEAALAELMVMQRTGWMTVSPAEMSRSCDLLLVVGNVASEEWLARFFPDRKPPEMVQIGIRDAAKTLALIGACLNGVPAARLGAGARKLAGVVERLKAATFGVAVWRQGVLAAPVVEMLSGIVRNLNQETRFSALSLSDGSQAQAANLVSGWLSGYPVRTSFAGTEPDHDPWAYSAERLISSGEADAALWISAFGGATPPWTTELPTVALVAAGTRFRTWPKVIIEVGQPGQDHDAILFEPSTGALNVRAAAQALDAPQVAAVLDHILEQLKETGLPA